MKQEGAYIGPLRVYHDMTRPDQIRAARDTLSFWVVPLLGTARDGLGYETLVKKSAR